VESVPKALEDAVQACLAKEPGDRAPQDTFDLAECLSSIELDAPESAGTLERSPG